MTIFWDRLKIGLDLTSEPRSKNDLQVPQKEVKKRHKVSHFWPNFEPAQSQKLHVAPAWGGPKGRP